MFTHEAFAGLLLDGVEVGPRLPCQVTVEDDGLARLDRQLDFPCDRDATDVAVVFFETETGPGWSLRMGRSEIRGTIFQGCFVRIAPVKDQT